MEGEKAHAIMKQELTKPKALVIAKKGEDMRGFH